MSAALFNLEDTKTTLVVRYSPAIAQKYKQRLRYIGRHNDHYKLPASEWCNPYRLCDWGWQAFRKYADHLLEHPALFNRIVELKGLVLACWCRPGKCHGDLLALVANALPDYATREIVIGPDWICNFCFSRLLTAHHAESCAYYVNTRELWAQIL